MVNLGVLIGKLIGTRTVCSLRSASADCAFCHLPRVAAPALAPDEPAYSHGYLRGGYGLEGTHLIGARTNDSGGGLGHFIPGTWEIAERFRDHQPSLITQAVEDLNLRV